MVWDAMTTMWRNSNGKTSRLYMLYVFFVEAEHVNTIKPEKHATVSYLHVGMYFYKEN